MLFEAAAPLTPPPATARCSCSVMRSGMERLALREFGRWWTGHAEYVKGRGDSFPGARTRYDEVRLLTPNTLLDLGTTTVHRFFRASRSASVDSRVAPASARDAAPRLHFHTYSGSGSGTRRSSSSTSRFTAATSCGTAGGCSPPCSRARSRSG